MSEVRTYNAEGLLKLTAAATELVPMIASGSESEVKEAIVKLYETARREFPLGPRMVSEALCGLCSELDLPVIYSVANKDSGEIL